METRSKKSAPGLETFPYDVVDFLGTPEDRAEYLDVWFEDFPEDIRGLSKAIGDIARAQGMGEVVAATGLSHESLHRALNQLANPSFATVMKVLNALGIRLRAELVNQEGAGASNDESDAEDGSASA